MRENLVGPGVAPEKDRLEAELTRLAGLDHHVGVAVGQEKRLRLLLANVGELLVEVLLAKLNSSRTKRVMAVHCQESTKATRNT
jgi:hypothetical protein